MLYDQLLEIGNTEGLDTDNKIKRCWAVSMDYFKSELRKLNGDHELVPLINRIDNCWNLVSAKTGDWAKTNAFSIALKALPQFKDSMAKLNI